MNKKMVFAAIVSALILGGCSSVGVKNVGVERKVAWEYAGNLPAQKGFEKNIGVAGVLSGVLNNKYVLVGGGANFPYEPVAKGGAKQSYSDVYLLQEKGDRLEVVEQINLDNEIGYGSSITTKEGVYYIGGSANKEADNDILFFSMKNNKLSVEKVGDLPFTLQNGVAVEKDGKLYVLTGKQDGVASDKMISYDLKTKEVKELASIPGGARTQALNTRMTE